MKVYVVYEYAVIEYEECFRIMGVFSDEDLAAEVIREYEKNEPDCDYQYEEFELDRIWEDYGE